MFDEEKDILIEYDKKFGDLPPILMMVTYEHPIYQELMSKAIETGEPITLEQVEEAFKDVKYDKNNEEEQ